MCLYKGIPLGVIMLPNYHAYQQKLQCQAKKTSFKVLKERVESNSKKQKTTTTTKKKTI